jgi:hypothetical protein
MSKMEQLSRFERPRRRRTGPASAPPSPDPLTTQRRSPRHQHRRQILPLAILLLSLTTPASAQSTQILDPAVLPSCALTCPVLLDAQKACVPPAVAAGSPTTYNSCFCSSNLLAGSLKAGNANGLCQGGCTPADMARVQTWFNGLCNSATATTPTAAGPGPTTLGPTQNKDGTGSGSPTW